jgi:hypothetical protein
MSPAANGSVGVVVRQAAPERHTCRRTREEIKASGTPLPCICGGVVSRCW